MNQPKPVQIRLPFSVPRPKKGQEPASRLCGICRLKDSRYTCPRCNVAYCSLDCFRSEKHNQCSEPFYRGTLLESISSDPAAGIEEKKGMMDMLRRFEEEQGGDELPGGLEEDGEEDLAEKLAGIDLDTNALFHLLPPEHREKFIAALKNPESDEARHLLEMAAEEGHDDVFQPGELPWWEAPDVPEDNEDLPYASIPHILDGDVIAGIKPPEGVGLKLAYNAIAVCIAYINILLSNRLPLLSESYLSSPRLSPSDLKSDFSTLIPFLADQKSTVRYNTAREAYSAVWEVIGTEEAAPPPDLLIRLLSPVPSLLHPPLDTTSSPKILLLLSDLYNLYSGPKAGAAGKKLAFYVVALGQLERADWLKLEREVQGELRRLETETGDKVEAEDDERSQLMI